MVDKPDRDRNPGERDGPASRGHGRGQGVGTALPRSQLVPEAVDDEERIVDGDCQPDQRHDVQGVLRDIGDAAEQECSGEAAHDCADPDPEREACGHHRSEDEEQQDQRHRQRDRLGPGQVTLERSAEVAVDRHIPGTDHRQAAGTDSRPQRRVVGARLLTLTLDVDADERLVTIF